MKRFLGILVSVVMLVCMIPVGFAAASKASEFDPAQFKLPNMEYRPGVRWWWALGAETGDLIAQIDYLADNGFNAVEINPFNSGFLNGIDGTAFKAWSADNTIYPDENLYSFETPEYYAKLKAVIAHAAERGITVDLNMGSGYEANSTLVTPEQSMEQMVLGVNTVTVSADQVGTAIELEIPELEMSSIYDTVACGIPEAEWLGIENAECLIVGRITGEQEIVRHGFMMPGAPVPDPEYQSVIDSDSIAFFDLTSLADGATVTFTPDAEGDWAIVAVYDTASGTLPIRGVYGDGVRSLVVDHMEDADVTAYINEWLGNDSMSAIVDEYADTIRAAFNDSYEFYLDNYYNHQMYDMASDADGILGYDFAKYLALFSKEAPSSGPIVFDMTEDELTRITYDYDLLVNELILSGEKAFSDALAEYDMLYRQQAYNPPLDVLKTSQYVDIPETEGLDRMSLKEQVSGAHLYGKNTITAEVFTLGTTPYQTTLSAIRKGLDTLAVSGVTNYFYHGLSSTYYGSEDAQAVGGYGETGWRAWPGIGIESGEVNPISGSFLNINTYASRLNYINSIGAYDGDALIYMGTFGTVNTEGGFMSSGTPDYMYALDRYGLTWDAVNDDCIQNYIVYQDGELVVTESGLAYDMIIIPSATLPVETMTALQALAEEGAPIIFLGDALPAAQPSYAGGDYALLDQEVNDIAVSMTSLDNVYALEKSSDAIGGLFAQLAYAPVSLAYNEHTNIIRRSLESGGEIAFIKNTDTEAANNITVNVDSNLVNCYWLNQEDGVIYTAEKNADGTITLPLEASGSIALLCEPEGFALDAEAVSEGAPLSMLTAQPVATYALTDFSLTVTADNLYDGKMGEEQTVTFRENVLGDWSSDDFQGGALKFVSDVGSFETTLALDAVDGQYVLSLNSVSCYGDVYVNDTFVGQALYNSFDLDITSALVAGDNTIRIDVQPMGHNRRAGFARAYLETGEQQYEYYWEYVRASEFGLKEDALLPTGLFGPVVVSVY